MPLHTTESLARSDRPATSSTTTARPQTITAHQIRLLGGCLAIGSVTWAIGLFTMGTIPTESNALRWNLMALAFQLGVLGLVHVQLRTRATGAGKLARRLLYIEHALLVGAIASTCLGFAGTNTSTLANVLDVFWPLSMLGMLAVGVRVAVAGRWTGLARYWPLIAESWAVVSIPAAKSSAHLGGIVGGTHLLIGYALLGVILALKPALTQSQD